MWRKYFTVKNVVPGRIKTPRHGIIDLSSDDLSLEVLRELWEEDWRYIEITEEGRNFFYGKPKPIQSKVEKPSEPVDTTDETQPKSDDIQEPAGTVIQKLPAKPRAPGSHKTKSPVKRKE